MKVIMNFILGGIFFNIIILMTLSCSINNNYINENRKFYGAYVRMNNAEVINIESEQVAPKIDTLSLRIFWNSLQKSIVEDKRQDVIEKFNFPIRSIFPVIFKYAHDCDTTSYTKNEEKYNDVDITPDNIKSYYDFVFTEELKRVIIDTSIDDLLSKGHLNEKIPGLTYAFFPKNYNIKVNCINDHNMKFYFLFKNTSWRITISGL